MTLSTVDVEVMCGPHPQKRHRSDHAVALTARLSIDDDLVFLGEGYRAWEFFGLVEQNVYRPWIYGFDGAAAPGELIYDERVGSRSASRQQRDRSREEFDQRWASASPGLEAAAFGGEEAVRQKAIVRCPVCGSSVAFHDVAELRAILDPLAGKLPTLKLTNLRILQLNHQASKLIDPELNKNEKSRKMR